MKKKEWFKIELDMFQSPPSVVSLLSGKEEGSSLTGDGGRGRGTGDGTGGGGGGRDREDLPPYIPSSPGSPPDLLSDQSTRGAARTIAVFFTGCYGARLFSDTTENYVCGVRFG